MISCEVSATKPFSFLESHWYLDRNFDDCMHVASPGAVTRAIATSAGTAVIRVSGSNSGVQVEVVKGREETLSEACAFVEEWLDLRRDLRPFYSLLRQDAAFDQFPKKYKGFHMVGIPDLFECLIWCIAGQQISLPFAYMLKRRIVEAYGERVACNGKDYWLFPRPEVLSRCTVEQLKKFQFTTRKCEYIIGIAKAFAEGALSKPALQALGDEEKMLSHLTGFRGIGVWTANYALMKSLGAMNRIPYGDAGVNQALAKFTGLQAFDARAVDRIFDRYEGWKTYLVYYLWRSRREMA